MLPALVVALALAAAPAAQRGGRSAPTELDVVLGTGLRDLDGRTWTGRTAAGKVVILDVWATWCAPCLAELPTLKALQAAYDRDVVILGVSLDTMSRRDFTAWLARHDVRWPQHHDRRGYGGPAVERLGVDFIPRSFLFDRQGRLAGRDLRGPALAEAVARLVDARTPGGGR